MSGEYFSEDKPKFHEGKSSQRDEKRCPYGGDCPSPKHDHKLHEMGEALEIAETRCNTLKEQLDHMKLLYRQKDELSSEYESKREKSPRTQKILTRQNSGAIGTDNSGAAVVTINNILSGITNSINRLSELHSYMETDNATSSRQNNLRANNFRSNSRVDNSQDVSSVEIRSRDSIEDHGKYAQNNRVSNHSISFKNRRKEPKRRAKKRSVNSYEHSTGSLIQMKPKGRPSRVRSVTREENKEVNKNAKKQKKSIKRLKSSKMSVVIRRSKGQPNNLVEIYHNTAAKGSESDDSQIDGNESNFTGNRISHIEIKPKLKKTQEAIPPISIPSETRNESYSGFAKSKNQMLSPIEEHQQYQQHICYDHMIPEYNHFTHSYEAPTIASRMKQVARNYFRHFHSKTIPFCAAKSTTPSHNIGINIQQVMNIIKTRQPIKGISPTLAHNIGIAAERLNNQSLSAIVSSLGTRMGYACYPCPMLKNNMNFQHLQEMAKDIPEIPEEMEGEGDADHVSEQNGDEQDKVEEVSENVWAVDPSHVNCTCVAKQGVGFQQILNKYQQNRYVPTPFSGQSQYSQKIMARSNQKYKHIKSVYAQYNDVRRKKDSPIQSLMNTKVDSNIPLQGKEKVLKGVLVNLHAEFAQLSDKYDELTKDVNLDDCEIDPEQMKGLELLEKKLNDKEEEIQMVMSLYNEVVNLKQQVKALRERASMASLMVEQQKQNYYLNQRRSELANSNSPRNTRDLKVGAHLTKLLRQLQTYQDINKNGGK